MAPLPDRPKRQASSLYLRMPRVDWAKLCHGSKTEFRLRCGRSTPRFHKVKPPVPVIGFSLRLSRADTETALFVLEEISCEPLRAISPESLEREGYDTLAEFRRYWRTREQRLSSAQRVGWAPLAKVMVYRVRPFTEEDIQPHALRLLHHLYGDFLPDGDLEP